MSEQLPLEIQWLASSIFAKKTGFSGPEIFDWFSQFSDEIGEYPWQGAPARPVMFKQCLEHFSVERQCDLLLKLTEYQGPSKYRWPTQQELEKFKGLVLAFAASPTGSRSILTQVDWQSVREAWQKALERVSGDPEGAITAARTTLESVCKHILDRSGIQDQSRGDLVRLYRATAQELQLSPNGYSEDVFKQILGGCAGIAAGLSGLRNAFGDSHGKGRRYIKPQPRHARLAINAAMTLAEFLIETYEARRQQDATPTS